MIQLLFFCFAVCAGLYGVLSGNLLSLVGATLATLLAASNLFGHLPVPKLTQQELLGKGQQHGWLMLAGLAILCAGLATWQAHQAPFSLASGYLWLAAMIVMVIGSYVHDQALDQQAQSAQAKSESSRPSTLGFDGLDWLLVGTITLMALALRLYRLTDFLPTMHGDEGEMGLLALLALHGPASGLSPNRLPLFQTAFLDHPTLFHYLQAGALWLFGESLTGLRTLSALFGALCVPVVYGIGRVGWGRIAGVTAAWLLAVSHLHLHYSRIALNNVQSIWFTALFILLMLLAFAKTVREQPAAAQPQRSTGRLIAPLVPYAWAGLIMGFSQYFYYGSRLIPVIAVPLLLFLLLKRRLAFPQLIVLTVATLVAYAPLAGHYGRNLPAFLNRTQGVTVFTPEGMAAVLGPQALWPADLPRLVWEQVTRNAAFFVSQGDASTFYFADSAAFDPVTVGLFWLGLGVVLARLYRFPDFALLVWFVLGFCLAGVATNNAPNGPRLIIITTTVYLIGGVLLQRLFNWAARITPTGSKLFAVVAMGAIAVVTFQSNFNAYFVTYARYTPNMLPISMAHMVRDLGSDYTFYLFGAPHFYADYSVLRFIAPETARYNVDTAEQVPAPAEISRADKGIVLIALPHRFTELDRAIERLPGGLREEHFNRVGELIYVSYQVANPPATAALAPPPAPQSPLAPTATMPRP